MRTMSALKNQIYFNVKQMLFGGFYGSDSQMNDSSRYTEWEHAGDLLGCRTKSIMMLRLNTLVSASAA